ncbi:hypothetical protein LTS18_012219, partial [Coniosporium uncinatum]
MSGLKLGLNLGKKIANAPVRPAPKPKGFFGDDEDDAQEDVKSGDGSENITTFDLDDRTTNPKVAATSDSKAASKIPSKTKGASLYGDLSSLHSARKHTEQATELDPTIYDYDAAYDAIHAKTEAKKATERLDAQQRKPKYIGNLLESAEVRKRDQLRAKDKLLQREREAEGEEFADKEKFVTSAYKAQQEEVRRLEEEEKRKEEEEAKKKRAAGMQGFYRSMMDQDEKKHQEAMEAAAEAGKQGTPKDEENVEKEKTEAELAREANAKGGNIIINDEGQVADKRQLLSAGLNVAPKPKGAATAPTAASKAGAQQQAYQGRNANHKAMRDRQT